MIAQVSRMWWTILLLIPLSIFAQEAKNNSFKLLDSLSVEETAFFTVDKLKQIYIVNKENDLIKYSVKGKEQFRYNNNKLGTLTFVDVTNPFNILLFYADFRTLISLDRNLVETGSFDLYTLDVNEIKAIAQSSDNNIWLYDDVTFKLKKIRRSGDILIESDDLSLLMGSTIAPNFILERDNRVYVNDPTVGILVFDIFGKYLKTLNFKDLNQFQIANKQLFYKENLSFNVFHLQSLLNRTIVLPQQLATEYMVFLQSDFLYLKNNDFIYIYQL